MILDIIQTSKELFSAEFRIIENGLQIGSFYLKGSLGSMEAEIFFEFKGIRFKLVNKRLKGINTGVVFRPYIIYSYNNESAGYVYQTEVKLGLFKGYSLRKMDFGGRSLELYCVGMGKDGYKFPIYEGEKQIAEIDKGCVVYNELHEYRLYAVDEASAMISAMLCAYLYVSGPYTPGEKVTRSVVKSSTVTTNKLLKAKYNPDFVSGIEE